MSSWGISDTASEKEKIKSEFADFINGLNSSGDISYGTYCALFDFTMPLFDKMFEIALAQHKSGEAKKSCEHLKHERMVLAGDWMYRCLDCGHVCTEMPSELRKLSAD